MKKFLLVAGIICLAQQIGFCETDPYRRLFPFKASVSRRVNTAATVVISTMPCFLYSVSVTSVGAGSTGLTIFDSSVDGSGTPDFSITTLNIHNYNFGPYGVYMSSGITVTNSGTIPGDSVITWTPR